MSDRPEERERWFLGEIMSVGGGELDGGFWDWVVGGGAEGVWTGIIGFAIGFETVDAVVVAGRVAVVVVGRVRLTAAVAEVEKLRGRRRRKTLRLCSVAQHVLFDDEVLNNPTKVL